MMQVRGHYIFNSLMIDNLKNLLLYDMNRIDQIFFINVKKDINNSSSQATEQTHVKILKP